MRSHKRMLDFRIGGRVSFQCQTGATVTGVLTRYNKRTVMVVTDSASDGPWRRTCCSRSPRERKTPRRAR
jgi:hypothetical protein